MRRDWMNVKSSAVNQPLATAHKFEVVADHGLDQHDDDLFQVMAHLVQLIGRHGRVALGLLQQHIHAAPARG